VEERGPKPLEKWKFSERHLYFAFTYEIVGLVKMLSKILWEL